MLASTLPINTILRLITLQLVKKQTAGKRFKVSEALKNTGKRGAKSQFDSIRQSCDTPPTHAHAITSYTQSNAHLNQSGEKVPDLPSSLLALGETCATLKCVRRKRLQPRCGWVRSPPFSSVLLLSPTAAPRNVRSSLPARATPSAPLQNRFTKSALWKGCKSLPLAVSKVLLVSSFTFICSINFFLSIGKKRKMNLKSQRQTQTLDQHHFITTAGAVCRITFVVFHYIRGLKVWKLQLGTYPKAYYGFALVVRMRLCVYAFVQRHNQQPTNQQQ